MRRSIISYALIIIITGVCSLEVSAQRVRKDKTQRTKDAVPAAYRNQKNKLQMAIDEPVAGVKRRGTGISRNQTGPEGRTTLHPVGLSDQVKNFKIDDEITLQMQSPRQPLTPMSALLDSDTTFIISWRQPDAVVFSMPFYVPGDSLAQWFVPMSACTLRTVRIFIKNFEGDMILNVYGSNYKGQIESLSFTDANGWLGAWEDSVWVPGTNMLMNVSPFGRKIWGPDTITVTSADHNQWLEIPTSELGDPNLGSSPFMIGFQMNPTDGYRITTEMATTPYHFFKFYASSQSPSGNPGWHIRSYSMWVEAEVSYYGDIPPLFDEPYEVETSTSTDPRTVSVRIVDFNPSGGAAGVDMAEVRYRINEGEPQSIQITDFDGDEVFTGTLPGFQPGDDVVYHYWARDVEANENRTSDFEYAIFEVEDPILVIYNESDIVGGYFPHQWMQQFYFFGYGGYEWSNGIIDPTVYRYDLWDGMMWGKVNPEVLENYDVVLQLDNQFPAEINSPQLFDWISAGTPESPRRLFFASQDYPWKLNPARPDTTFPPGSFEYDYLGIESFDSDVFWWNRTVHVRGVSGDSISGFVEDYSDTTGLPFKYAPGATIGRYQWIDFVYPTAAADTAFKMYSEGFGPVGIHTRGPGFQSVYLAFDPLGCLWTNDVDTNVWVINVDNIIGKALEWFDAPIGQAQPPTLFVEPAALDFGSLAVGETAVLELHLSNPGTEPLEIFDIKSSTLLVTVSDTDAVIQPGDTFTIQLTFTPMEIEPLDEELTILSNDPATPSRTVSMTAEVFTTTVDISTDQLNFGLVHLGNVDTLEFEISNSGQSPLEIYDINSTNDAFAVSETTLTVFAGDTAFLEAYFVPIEIGLEQGNLVVVSNDPSNPDVTIACEGIGFDPAQLTPEPRIISVSDVPSDQGGRVRILWTRSVLDEENSGQTLTYYVVWRRSPSLDDHWEYIELIPTSYFNLYGFTSPTLGDSTQEGMFWSDFKVAIYTDAPDVFYMSAVASGYSTDDLSPQVPLDVQAKPEINKIILTWQEVPDVDLAHYSVYRGDIAQFEPDTAYATIGDTIFADTSVGQDIEYFYKISASDFSGNESSYSTEVSAVITDVEGKVIPETYELSQNYPNPFNPKTTLRFALPEEKHVRLTIYNLHGYITDVLVDEKQGPGRYEITWDASNLASGIYFYRLQAGDFVQTRKMVLLK